MNHLSYPLLGLTLGMLLLAAAGTARAQELRQPEIDWRRFALSTAAHGAGTAFDSWTSWQHIERNRFLAENGRFTGISATKKGGTFAAITAVQFLVIRKWGKRRPWLEKAFSVANFTSAGMYTSAGFRNLSVASR